MIEKILDIPTKDGAIETFVCHPERGGPYPPVLFLMDAPGILEELYDMARRLATVGYYVLLPNLYYRAGKDTKYGPDVLEKGSKEQARMRTVRTKMTIPPSRPPPHFQPANPAMPVFKNLSTRVSMGESPAACGVNRAASPRPRRS